MAEWAVDELNWYLKSTRMVAGWLQPSADVRIGQRRRIAGARLRSLGGAAAVEPQTLSGWDVQAVALGAQ